MKVYIVTQGCWEDFSIVKLFATEEQAKAFCDEYNFGEVNEDSYYYQEYDVSEEMTEKQDKQIHVSGDFNNDNLYDFYVEQEYNDHRKESFCQNFEEDDENNETVDWVDFSFTMTARKDENMEQFEERARKVAIDKYFQWKAGKVNESIV